TSYYGIPLKNPEMLLSRLNWMQKFLLALPLLSGTGILLRSIWGYIVFLLNALLLTGFNIYALIHFPVRRNVFSLLEVILVTAVCLYLLRKNIGFGFIRREGGFRRASRKEIPVEVEIVGGGMSVRLLTEDLSRKGFSVKWENCPLEINSETNVRIQLSEGLFSVRAGAVRKDGSTVGFAFRGISSEVRTAIRKEMNRE
ncbi:MAG TPA: PilZ domain-containing protein, partial [Leptospiraceae bacterium]|nr:PilZ domain-containing protein [Leptospiraceae bacterium]